MIETLSQTRAPLAALALCGCATMFTGTTDKLKFDANVSGVRLTVDGHFLGELIFERASSAPDGERQSHFAVLLKSSVDVRLRLRTA